MNKLILNQPGGFPLTQDVLDFMQTQYQEDLKAFSVLGSTAPAWILSGCGPMPSQPSITMPGKLIINGEIVDFLGGTSQPYIFVVEQDEEATFEDGQDRTIIKRKRAIFGTGAGQILASSLKRVPSLYDLSLRVTTLEKKTAPIGIGAVILWNRPANEIPAGWVEVTEMQGKMPIGLDLTDGTFATLGASGGGKTITIGVNNLPSFSIPGYRFQEIHNTWQNGGSPSPNDGTGRNEAQTLNFDGSNQAINILNPYRVVMFIKYVG